MKKILLILILFFTTWITYSQSKFSIEIIDSIKGKSKSEIYSATKLFIAEYWVSANAVIQNDDKENGIILIKGLTKSNLDWREAIHSYTLKFYMKDERCRIILDNVECVEGNMALAEEYPGARFAPYTRYIWEEFQKKIRENLYNIPKEYINYLKSSKEINNDW
jgi:hypothetical protein